MANLKSQQVTEYVKIGLYLSLAYFGFKAIKSLAETFGLSKTESEVLTDEATTDVAQSTTEASSNPFLSFSPMYSNALVTAWKKSHPNQVWNIPKQEKLPRLQYLDLAKDINESNGYFNDDENRLYSVFSKIETQYQLSLLSRVFTTYYKKDLFNYLKSFLNASELQPILNKVKNYPQYFK